VEAFVDEYREAGGSGRRRSEVGITVDAHGFCVHSLRATTATNTLAHHAVGIV
jgi:hypothetical protein